MKKLLTLVLVLCLFALPVSASMAEGQRGGPRGGGNGGMGGMRGGAGTDKSSDAELQAMIEEVAPKFQLLTFQDPVTGASLSYQLYVPEDYDPAQSYPLIQFIPDSSVVGKGADAVLSQGWGGLIWATDAEQAKHPSFVFIPVFTETVVNDSFQHSEQIDTSMRLLKALQETYSIDSDRIYATGQSMGGMTAFYESIDYPDVFAAYFFVGSQWDTGLLQGLEDTPFFYVVAAGDAKASAGLSDLMALFDADAVTYAGDSWSAQDDAETQKAAVEAMLTEGCTANFVTFTLGSTLASGQSSGGAGEHMTSFDYAYRLEAVRDWLYAQTK